MPYCRTRCGYCDFNTYTALELARPGTVAPPGSAMDTYVDVVLAELDLARAVLGRRRVPTVFVGGGTPTLLPSRDLVRLIAGIADRFDLDRAAEVTTEANPETVSESSLAELRSGGFTRVSFGMQSAVPHVLAALDRVHTPGRAVDAVREARAAGFDDVSLDLIYGTPGESDADWQTSLDAVVDAAPDHVSAYALIVEEGTALARRIARGILAAPDDDELADRYLAAEAALGEKELRRTSELVAQKFFSPQQLDAANARVQASRAALSAARSQRIEAESAVLTARSQIVESEAAIESAQAAADRIQVEIADAVLRAPRGGRVQTVLAQGGEVLAGGGRVVSLVDLSDVTMNFFLPETAAGRVAIGAEARLVLDAAPKMVIPAQVDFVASVAQFTPKTVETESERQKMVFKVRARVDPVLLGQHRDQVKTGLPGMAYVRTGVEPWPPELAVNVPEARAAASAPTR